ncbi:MAG: cardiolipin synthase, partial [Oscillospiraceae bacterium]|nr:cardiolipin synthase [Oscillospiraceae bacterium]
HTVTRSFYPQLIAGGVKVYEYMPGFIHSKVFVSDDITATVGTVNLDYRSLYLHFECGVWMTGCSAIADIKQDFLTTLKSCHEITGSDLQQKGRGLRQLVAAIIRVFAPLM